jgi:hypothetical protein
MVENEITEKIIGAAIKVHQRLGPGLLESAYQACLFYEFQCNPVKRWPEACYQQVLSTSVNTVSSLRSSVVKK